MCEKLGKTHDKLKTTVFCDTANFGGYIINNALGESLSFVSSTVDAGKKGSMFF
jgi:hypothetical protein